MGEEHATLRGAVSDDGSQLVLYHTLLCSAECAHCIVEAGPRRRGRLPLESARAAIDGAARNGSITTVVFSGGESFIYLDDVLSLCQQARRLGLRTRVVTNAYWARSVAESAAQITRVFEGGVDEIFVSFDEFHLPYVEPERVINVVRGAEQAARLPYIAYCTVVRSEAPAANRLPFAWPEEVLRLLILYGFDLDRCVPQTVAHERLAVLSGADRETFKESMIRHHTLIAWQTLSHAGRAAAVQDSEALASSAVPCSEFPCEVVGRLPTITPEGRLFPCCSSWSNFQEHSFGRISSPEAFAERTDAMRMDPLVNFIHARGPGPLIDYLRDRGSDLAPPSTDICGMCDLLFRRCSASDLRNAVANLTVSRA